MQIDLPRRRQPAESAVPMINVVFLLLIFFLMAAVIAPPLPFAVSPPLAEADRPAEAAQVLYLAADGRLAWGEARDEEVFAALAEVERQARALPLTLYADGTADAAAAARLLRRLAELGYGRVELVVDRP